MKVYAPLVLLAASCWLSLASAATGGDPLASLRFCDGKSRTLDDFQKQGVLVMYFCGHCPNAAAYLGKQTRELYDFIESRKVPVTLVLATPDQAIETAFSSSSAGEFRYPVDGLSDATAKDVWWQVERQRSNAVRTLVASAKGKAPAQLELQKVPEVVKASFAQRESDLAAAPVSMATYESLEALLAEAQGLELKDASLRYKALGKAKELRSELDARSAFQQCQAMAASPRPDSQAGAKAGFAQIAKKYPETLYGQRAASQQ